MNERESTAGPSSQQKPPAAENPTSSSNTPETEFIPTNYYAPYKLSPRQERRVDERCFTWCSQTSGGRVMQQPPWCRSLCFRRVYKHELETPVQTWKGLPPVGLTPRTANPTVREWPLPPEGQPAEALREDGTVATNQHTKYWREGWYLWYGEDFMAAQEHGHVMSMTFPEAMNFVDWRAYMQKIARDAEAKRRRDLQRWNMDGGVRSGLTDTEKLSPEEMLARQEHEAELQEPVVIPPDLRDTSILTPFPPSVKPLLDLAHAKTVAPMNTVYNLVHKTFEDGSQARFWDMAYKKALSRDPWITAHQMLSSAWERWKSGKDDPPKDGGI